MTPSTSKDVARLTTTVATGTPYQLDNEQVNKATIALLAHTKSYAAKKEQEASKKNLLADSDNAEEGDAGAVQSVPVWLTVGTKKHITDQIKLKPSKIVLPHSIHKGDLKICLITIDPQRTFKDLIAHPSFPTSLSSQIGRVVGLSKIKAKLKSYESRRQLAAEYDLFLADERVVRLLPKLLGKVFYSGNGKRPIPVNLTAGIKNLKEDSAKKAADKTKKTKEEKEIRVGTPEAVAKEIESALSSTLVNLSTSTNSSIKVGHTGMTAEQLDSNISVVVEKLAEKFIPKGWRGIRGLYIKGPNTMALPIWLADELWTDEGDVLEEKFTYAVKDKEGGGEKKVNEKKRRWDEWESELLDEETLKERRERRRPKKSKGEDKEEEKEGISSKKSKRKLKESALKELQAPLVEA